MNDAEIGPLAQQIIVLRFTSALLSQDAKGNNLFDFPEAPQQLRRSAGSFEELRSVVSAEAVTT